MKNLIYIDVENFTPNKLSSKIKYLFFELGFYFDGSEKLRDLGFEIAIKLFGASAPGFNSKLMIFKRYFAFYLRIVMLLIVIGVATMIFKSDAGPFAIILPVAIMMGGVVFFIFFLSQKELEIIDNSQGRFMKRAADKPLPPITSVGVIAITGDSNSRYSHQDISEKTFEAELNKLRLRRESFIGFPIGLIIELLKPLGAAPFGMNRKQLLDLFHNMIHDTDRQSFIIPRGNVENYKTFLYCVYQYLDGVSYKFVKRDAWNKGVFCARLYKCFLNLRELKVEDLRVHANKIDFSTKIEKHFKAIEPSRYSDT